MKCFLVLLLITYFFVFHTSSLVCFPKAKSTRLCFLHEIFKNKKKAILDFEDGSILDFEEFVNCLFKKRKCSCKSFPCNGTCSRQDVLWLKLRENTFFDFGCHYFYGLGLHNLQILDLYDNDIYNIPKESFKWLPRLVYLFLNNNKIKRIGILGFEGLKSLEVLDLSNNPIESFNIEDLDCLPKLKWLGFKDIPISDSLLEVLEKRKINLY